MKIKYYLYLLLYNFALSSEIFAKVDLIYTNHAKERMVERHISKKDIESAYSKGYTAPASDKSCLKYIYRGTCAVINPSTKAVITTYSNTNSTPKIKANKNKKIKKSKKTKKTKKAIKHPKKKPIRKNLKTNKRYKKQ